MTSELRERIVKKGGKWCVVSHTTGKSFGCYSSEAAAKKRLKQIQHFKKESKYESDKANSGRPHARLSDGLQRRMGGRCG